MDRYQSLLGCLMGTALGDAVGLRREGLSRQRAARLYGSDSLKPDLIFGKGFCSDDTEHTQMVARALVLSKGNLSRFEIELGRQLRCWLLTLPAGIGLATLRACIKITIGIGPTHSGVFSAGNGPAMRSALLGLWAESDTQLQELVRCSTKITHTDPKAQEGALLVARAAQLTAKRPDIKPVNFIAQMAREVEGEELRDHLQAAVDSLTQNKRPAEFAESRGWSKGVSGYVNHTVPAALYCWAYSPNDFRKCVENTVLLGGDTDSVAAIAGAICGANLGYDKLPKDWIDSLIEWPRTTAWVEELAKSLDQAMGGNQSSNLPSMHWLATIPRNLIFATFVIAIGLRRLLPPY